MLENIDVRELECGCVEMYDNRDVTFSILIVKCGKHPKGYLSKDWYLGKIVNEFCLIKK